MVLLQNTLAKIMSFAVLKFLNSGQIIGIQQDPNWRTNAAPSLSIGSLHRNGNDLPFLSKRILSYRRQTVGNWTNSLIFQTKVTFIS
jgi:hypothetical protein